MARRKNELPLPPDAEVRGTGTVARAEFPDGTPDEVKVERSAAKLASIDERGPIALLAQQAAELSSQHRERRESLPANDEELLSISAEYTRVTSLLAKARRMARARLSDEDIQAVIG